jgi:phosphatidate cytidylyltransferase
MLLQRVITALVLVALLLASLWSSSPLPFTVFTLALMAAAGWEWGRLNQAPPAGAWALGAGVAAGGAVSLWLGLESRAPQGLWWAVLGLWLIGAPAALRVGPSGWPLVPRALRWLLGLALLWAAWLAMAQARAVGINFMLSAMALVWMADIAAYFGGRAFGRRRLALSISPGKSWEGVWSGLAGVLLLGLVWHRLDGWFASGPLAFDSPSLYSHLLQRLGWAGAAAALLALGGLGVVGDLIESLVKRAAGAKDSSGLLPGHGGVLDRVDALLPVLPAALAIGSIGSSGLGGA